MIVTAVCCMHLWNGLGVGHWAGLGWGCIAALSQSLQLSPIPLCLQLDSSLHTHRALTLVLAGMDTPATRSLHEDVLAELRRTLGRHRYTRDLNGAGGPAGNIGVELMGAHFARGG